MTTRTMVPFTRGSLFALTPEMVELAAKEMSRSDDVAWGENSEANRCWYRSHARRALEAVAPLFTQAAVTAGAGGVTEEQIERAARALWEGDYTTAESWAFSDKDQYRRLARRALDAALGGETSSRSTATGTYTLFIDGRQYQWPMPVIDGAQLRAVVPHISSVFQMVLEGVGAEPDRPISDADSFSLSTPGRTPLRFYSVPPAMFASVPSPTTGGRG